MRGWTPKTSNGRMPSPRPCCRETERESKMHRRPLLQASLAALPAPAFAQGTAARTLRVIPQANLTSLDPVWTTAVVTRNHAFLVYDQLCAQDAQGEIRPQMAEGWVMEPDGLAWTFT